MNLILLFILVFIVIIIILILTGIINIDSIFSSTKTIVSPSQTTTMPSTTTAPLTPVTTTPISPTITTIPSTLTPATTTTVSPLQPVTTTKIDASCLSTENPPVLDDSYYKISSTPVLGSILKERKEYFSLIGTVITDPSKLDPTKYYKVQTLIKSNTISPAIYRGKDCTEFPTTIYIPAV
jgi:hypothetical protein